jgi:hypothetical protein
VSSEYLYLGQPYGGRGMSEQVVLRGNNPGAGANFSFVIPSEYQWRPLGCTFTLTTSAAVANRFVTVQYLGADGNPWNASGAAVVTVANSVARYDGSMYINTGSWASGTDVFFPLDPFFLRGGDTLKINVANIDVADTLTLIYFTFDKYFQSYPVS